MTISYNLDVSRKGWFNAFKILFRWRGSIWRLVWKELVVWLGIYYTVMLLYRSEMVFTPESQRVFETLARHIEKRLDWIPLTFILAFFVHLVVDRWTRFIDNIGYIENVALTVAVNVRGTTNEDIVARRTLVRYLCLSQVLVFRDVSMRVRRRFPNLESIVQAGFLEENEKILFEGLDTNSNKYWLPINWACYLAFRLYKNNKEKTSCFHSLVSAKWYPTLLSCIFSPNARTFELICKRFVVYFAVYIYFILALIGRQFIVGSETDNKAGPRLMMLQIQFLQIDSHFPFMTTLQFVFYTALAIVDDTFDQVPILTMDRFKTQKDPLYAENAVLKHPNSSQFIGSAAHLVLAPEDEQIHMVPVKNEPIAEETETTSGAMNLPTKNKTIE